ncbi:hypothetical protein [Streptomyces anulatus]|uniref:hypothetical protein n=1 Tax=Streptomyces anulatus TaxID=1892 RepID=UPI00386ACD39
MSYSTSVPDAGPAAASQAISCACCSGVILPAAAKESAYFFSLPPAPPYTSFSSSILCWKSLNPVPPPRARRKPAMASLRSSASAVTWASVAPARTSSITGLLPNA